MGIIDTLSAAYTKLSRKIWLIVIPVALDIFIWLGPKISIAPWIRRLFTELQTAIESAAVTAPTDSSVLVSQALNELQTTLESFNLMSLLGWGRVGVSSVASILPIKADAPLVIRVTTDLQLITSCAVLLALGLMLACIFIGLVSQLVRGERISFSAELKRAPIHWLTLAVLYIPLVFISGIAILVGTMLGPFAFIIFAGILYVWLYLYFIPQAVIMDDASPMEAIRNSFIVVRTNFWSSLGFIVLTNLISAGFAFIWNRLMNTSVGIVVSIILNAIVGTGLLLAACFFYQDRLLKWFQLRQLAQSKSSNE